MTLPGNLDIEGIKEVLNPKTDVGRVARTMSVTQGSAWESMSMNIKLPPSTPTKSSPTSPSNVYPATLPAPRPGKSQTRKPEQTKESDMGDVFGTTEAKSSEEATLVPGPLRIQTAHTYETHTDSQTPVLSCVPPESPSDPRAEEITQTFHQGNQNNISMRDDVDADIVRVTLTCAAKSVINQSYQHSSAAAKGYLANLGGSHQEYTLPRPEEEDLVADEVGMHNTSSEESAEPIHNKEEVAIQPNRGV